MALIRSEPDGPMVLAVECSLCYRAIPPEAKYPLCSRCEGAAKAVGKQQANVTRTPVDYRDRRFG